MFTAESDGERILKIGQHLVKLRTRVGCRFFDSQSSRYIKQEYCRENASTVNDNEKSSP